MNGLQRIARVSGTDQRRAWPERSLATITPALGFLALFAAGCDPHDNPTVAACEAFDSFLERLSTIADLETKRGEVADLMACVEQHGTPLTEPSDRVGYEQAVFLFRGTPSSILFASDATGFVPEDEFFHVPHTKLFYLIREYEIDARLDYVFIVDGREIIDPLNPVRFPDGSGFVSSASMSEYRRPPEIDSQPGVPNGTLHEISFKSEILGNRRTLVVYLPHGYADGDERYRVLYVHDGIDYLIFSRIVEILDNLIHAQRIPPVIGVMVPPVDRDAEYTLNSEFAHAFVNELVPLIDRRFRTVEGAEFRGLLGASRGGLASIFIGSRYPTVFGNVAAQSGSFFEEFQEVLFDTISEADGKSIKFHVDVGTYEKNLRGRDLLSASRRLRQVLANGRFPVQYIEVHEGHSWRSWRARIDEALEFFWASRMSSAVADPNSGVP